MKIPRLKKLHRLLSADFPKLEVVDQRPVGKSSDNVSSEDSNPKRVKLIDVNEAGSVEYKDSISSIWVTHASDSLLFDDKEKPKRGDDLDNKHIDFGQQLIRIPYPNIHGFKSTLLLTKQGYHYPDTESSGSLLQI